MVVVTFPAPLLRRWRPVSCEHFHRERPRPRGLAASRPRGLAASRPRGLAASRARWPASRWPPSRSQPSTRPPPLPRRLVARRTRTPTNRCRCLTPDRGYHHRRQQRPTADVGRLAGVRAYRRHRSGPSEHRRPTPSPPACPDRNRDGHLLDQLYRGHRRQRKPRPHSCEQPSPGRSPRRHC